MATTPIRTFDLAAEYGVRWDRDKTLSALGYTYATAKAKFAALIPWLESLGWSNEEVLALYEFCAAWNDAFWRGNGYFSESPNYANLTATRCNIIAPHGAYRLNFPCLFNQGSYTGQGAGEYSGTPNQSSGGTGLYIDHGTWMKSRAPEQFCLKSITWGLESGYAECFTISGFRFEGGKTGSVHDPSYVSAGMGIWDSGEASKVESCYAFGFNSYGFMNVRGTPSRFDQCSAFSNGIFGLGLIGNDLSTVTVIGMSGDDNGALIGVRAGYNRPAGATVTIIGAKSESGKRQPFRKQKLFDGQGAGNWTITGAWAHAIDSPECVIAADFQTYNGQLDVRGLKFEGYTIALKLTAKGKTTTHSAAGDTPLSFIANEGGIVTTTRTLGGTAPVPPPPDPVPPVDPPPTGVWKSGPRTNTAANGTIPVGVTGTKVEFTGIKWTKGAANSYPSLVGIGNAGGVQLLPDGTLVVGNGTGTTATFSPAKLTNGVSTALTITFASQQLIGTLLNPPGRNDAFQGSWTEGKVS